MQQEFNNRNDIDPATGNPAGGQASATGISIKWQNGPLMKDGIRIAPTGAFVETLIAIVIDRLIHYQDSKFKSPYNAEAIEHLGKAIDALNRRTSDREKRGVEGTHGL